MGHVVAGKVIKEEEEEDEEEEVPLMGDDDLLREITSSLHHILCTSPHADILMGRIGAEFELKNGKEFEIKMEDMLRVIMRKRRKKKKKPTEGKGGGGGMEGAKQGEEGEDWLDSEEGFTPTEDEDEGEHSAEEDLSEWDGNDDRERRTLLMRPNLSSGWMPPPPYLGRPFPPPPPSGYAPPCPPFSHPSPPPPASCVHNGSGDEFATSDDQLHSPRKMPRMERRQNSNSVAAGDWDSDDASERCPRESSNDHRHTARFARAGSPMPAPPPTGRRILGEIVLPKKQKDEFDSDSDEEEASPQQSATVYRNQHPLVTVSSPLHRPATTVSQPYYPSPTPSPLSTQGTMSCVSPPSLMAADENSPMSTVGSTVSDTPPPPSSYSVFASFSIGTAPPRSITQQAERIFVFDSPDDPDLQDLSDLSETDD